MKKVLSVILAVIIAVMVAPFAFAAGTIDETESNDTFTAANMIPAGGEIRGNLSSQNDIDYFNVTPTKNGKLTFTFKHDFYDSSNGWDISIFRKNTNGTYNSLFSFRANRNSSESLTTIPISVIADTTYVVKIACPYSSSNYYTSKLYTVSYSFTETEYYEREYNNTFTNATFLPESKDIEGNLDTVNDEDYYYCTPNKNGKLQFVFKHSFVDNDTRGWDIAVYMKNKGGDYSVALTDTIRLNSGETWITLAIGAKANTTYCFKIACPYTSSNYLTNNQYSVSYLFDATEYYEREFNDSYATANTLPSGIAVSGVMIGLDNDFFSFVSAKTGKLSIDFIHPYYDDDVRGWDVYLYAKNGDGTYSQLSKTTVTLNKPETVSIPFDSVAGNTYCVKITVPWNSYNYRTTATYSVKCDYGGSSAASYSLSYNANGGSGAPSAQKGTSVKISGTAPTRDGYTFLGWSPDKTDTAATYQPGDTIILSSDTILYAVWELGYSNPDDPSDPETPDNQGGNNSDSPSRGERIKSFFLKFLSIFTIFIRIIRYLLSAFV